MGIALKDLTRFRKHDLALQGGRGGGGRLEGAHGETKGTEGEEGVREMVGVGKPSPALCR